MTNFKNDIDKHNLMMECSEFSYNPTERQIPGGCDVLAMSDPDDNTGFAAVALRHGKEIIIAFRGTEDFNVAIKEFSLRNAPDTKNDLVMWGKQQLPGQAYRALMFYDTIKKKYPDNEILLTGHSLGGSLAQIVGSWRKVKTCTFNPYGTRNILERANVKIDNAEIINYCNPLDPITESNGENQVGENYILWSKSDKKGKKGFLLPQHFLENNQPIDKQMPVSFGKIELPKEQREVYYEGQADSIYDNLPPRNGMVHVNAYKRDDGTKVREYWRRFPDADIISSPKKLSDMEPDELNHALDILMNLNK